MMCACINGCIEVVKYLLKRGRRSPVNYDVHFDENDRVIDANGVKVTPKNILMEAINRGRE